MRPRFLLGGRGVLPGVLLRELMTCSHRQPLTHPPSPLPRPKLDPGFASTPPVGVRPTSRALEVSLVVHLTQLVTTGLHSKCVGVAPRRRRCPSSPSSLLNRSRSALTERDSRCGRKARSSRGECPPWNISLRTLSLGALPSTRAIPSFTR